MKNIYRYHAKFSLSMKKLLISTISFLIAITATCQTSLVDPENPISRIDVGYSVDNFLVFTIVLNSKENSQTLQNLPSINFKASIEGQINWADEVEDKRKKTLLAVFQPNASSPFVFSADAKDGTSALIPSPSTRKWVSIEQVKLKYEIEGKRFELPYISVYPPGIQNNTKTELLITNRGKMTGKQKGEITLSTNDATPFEVLSIDVTQQIGTTRNNILLSEKALGNLRFANNGSIDLIFETKFDMDPAANYFVVVKSKKIGSGESLVSKSCEVVFTDEILRRILNKEPNFTISIDDKDIIMDEIRTEGKGLLGVRFVNPDYQKIDVKPVSKGGGTFEFYYHGLGKLPDNSFSYFYYTVNGVDLPQPYLIIKKAPVISDFKFTGTKENEVSLEFKLPEYVNKDEISIDIIGEKGNLIVGGSTVIYADPLNKSKFRAVLSNNLTKMVVEDTIIEVTFVISYSKVPLYSLGITIFNQELLNQKMAELIAETANKPNKRDEKKIKAIVEDLVKIGKAVGNSIDDQEVTKVIESLNNGDKEKIKSIMSDIGKWALVAGKIVLPFLI